MALPRAKESGSPKKKPSPKGRKGRGEAIAQYFKDVRSEFRKVIWPGREEVVSSTMVVLTTLAFFTIVIGVLDFVFSRLVEFVIP